MSVVQRLASSHCAHSRQKKISRLHGIFSYRYGCGVFDLRVPWRCMTRGSHVTSTAQGLAGGHKVTRIFSFSNRRALFFRRKNTYETRGAVADLSCFPVCGRVSSTVSSASWVLLQGVSKRIATPGSMGCQLQDARCNLLIGPGLTRAKTFAGACGGRAYVRASMSSRFCRVLRSLCLFLRANLRTITFALVTRQDVYGKIRYTRGRCLRIQ